MVEELNHEVHKKDAGNSPADYARTELSPLVAQYFSEVREMLARNPAPPELHRLRLATKRLRYTLELFRRCYGRGLETRLDELRDVQQLLGEVNDSAATGRLLNGMPATPERAKALQFLEEHAAHKASKFRKRWSEVFDAPGRERWWRTYLERQAHDPVRHD